MGYYSRISKSFEKALRLPLNECSKYVLISDCHRGTGTSNDNFLKNQNLYFAALRYYYDMGFTYIELGDGDELWENRSMDAIIETHGNVFWLLAQFRERNRLYMIYGNHDIVKKDRKYAAHSCDTYHCNSDPDSYWEEKPLLPNMTFYPGIILQREYNDKASTNNGLMDVYLTHGHQSSLLNSTLWPVARFLVRYVWKPLEHCGVLDPTSAAKNYTRRHQAERRLHHWAESNGRILITGHTHRPVVSDTDSYYYNCGSCVHPRCITCLEIEHRKISLVKWTLSTRQDRSLYVARELLSGPKVL